MTAMQRKYVQVAVAWVIVLVALYAVQEYFIP